MSKIVILGAGIAGIGAGYTLKDREHIIYEKKDYYGGLCSSFNIEGFTFDNGVHISFTSDDMVRNIFKQTNHITHYPNPYNFFKGIWIKHPIQSNLFKLSPYFKMKAIKSFVKKQKIKDPLNYEEWLYTQYGKVIAEAFPIIYTKKYWGIQAKHMSTNWIGKRMRQVDLEEILFGSYSEETNNGYYVKEMMYPIDGGFESFIYNLAKECNINLNKEVVEIDIHAKKIKFKDGDIINYNNLISSIPIVEIIKLIKNVPSEIKKLVEELDYTSLFLVSIGFKCNDIYNYNWYYIYDEDIWTSRIYAPSIKSKKNVPAEHSSIQMEIHFNHKKPFFSLDENDVLKNVEYSLRKLNYPINKIKFIDLRRIEFGNVVFKLGMEEKRDKVLKYLREQEIISIGRFGEWKYYWSDQSLISGINGALGIKRGEQSNYDTN